MRICTNDTLEDEIHQLRRIFNNNGYPAKVVERVIRVTREPAQRLVGPKKCPVLLRLPCIGSGASTSFEKKIRRTVGSAYGACAVNVVFTTRTMFTSSLMDRIPAQQRSNVIYLFQCRCDSRYVGKTTRQLEVRIKQHVPNSAGDERRKESVHNICNL